MNPLIAFAGTPSEKNEIRFSNVVRLYRWGTAAKRPKHDSILHEEGKKVSCATDSNPKGPGMLSYYFQQKKREHAVRST
jgi:hypothetical protein